jgi:copper chaperone
MIELTLPTMTCSHCVKAVTAALKRVDPGASVEIDLASHRVRVESVQPREALCAAVAEEGYTST